MSRLSFGKVRRFWWVPALLLLAAPPAFGQQAAAEEELLPPNAKPGECYTRVWVPAEYRTESVRVLTREASNRVEVTPARFEWVDERVLVRPATEKVEIVPAQYDWVEERVLVKPASKKLEAVPARYEWEEEKILDRPAHTIWKKGKNPLQQVKNGTGEIMCLVEVPATYKTVRKRVLKEKAHTREVEVPAEYTTVRKRVLKQPETVRKIEVPAEHKTVRVRKLVTPPQERAIAIPEEYSTVTKRTLLSDGHMEWRAILCETNVRPGIVTDIQRALQTAGHNPGPIDGVIGSQTQNAIQAFQSQKGLPHGGLTMETLKALGVDLRP